MFVGFARGTWGTSFAALGVLAFAALAVADGRAAASEPAVAPHAGPVRLFGSSENANADISPFPKWTGVLQRYARERALEDAPCAGGGCPLQDWKAFVATLKGQSRLRQLDAVNTYANRIPYRSDRDRYGTDDYWATPRESLARSADCEDYAIVKYLSLRKLGWPAEALRIVVLKHETRNELHAVLVAYLNGTAYVLDNLLPDVREHAAIRIYRPIFSINENAWYFHRDWNPASAVMVSRAEPAPAPAGAAGIVARAPAAQVAGPVPPAIDTVRIPRVAYRPPLVRPAARSFAANTGESLAAIFTGAGGARSDVR